MISPYGGRLVDLLVPDEELAEVVGSWKAHLIAAIGVIGLLSILYMMVFKRPI